MLIVATLAALLSVGQVQTPASEFFPLEQGMKWQYEYTGDNAGTYSQEVGEPVDLNGKLTAPLLIKTGSKVSQTTYYDVGSAGVYVLGHDPEKLFEKPLPVFQINEKGAKWEFSGPSPYEGDTAAGMAITGQSKLVGLRPVLGDKKLCLEVKSETKIGLTKSTATTFEQTLVYAKGVGLVEFEETIRSGKKTIKRKVKLIKFEGAKAVGG